jgi:inositol oxygenase
MSSTTQSPNPTPLASIEEWEEDVLARYPETDYDPTGKPKEAFRNYEAPARSTVREFYRLNHTYQTLAYVQQKREEYKPGAHGKKSIWEMMEFLNNLVDDSDPDTSMSQIQHLLQTAEGIRKDGHPRWFILTGLIHDLGKVLCLWGEPQWGVVGDTFPVGCKFSDKIVFPEFFEANPDNSDPLLSSEYGIYEPHCGLDNVFISWGHDEYMYRVAQPYLPKEGLAMIRYHSLYPVHREGAYAHLMSSEDHEMMKWVKAFNPYDLYTKSDAPPNVDELRPFYEDLIAEFFPKEIAW